MDARRKNGARVFALKAWSVKQAENGKFFIGLTACFDDKQKWRGPYKSLHYATTAIARKLAEEFVEREKRWRSSVIAPRSSPRLRRFPETEGGYDA